MARSRLGSNERIKPRTYATRVPIRATRSAAISVAEEGAIQKWIAADRRTRLQEFSPAKVRARLESAGFAEVMCANKDWYADLCERYTHVTPQTQPNLHNEVALPIVGGILQPKGLTLVLVELANVLGAVALVACKFAKLDDYCEELGALAKSEDP